MLKLFRFNLVILSTTAFLWGCTSAPDPSANQKQAPVKVIKNNIDAHAPELPYINFPPETMYSLLIAEYALRNGDYSSALTLYSQEAKKTRDPNISAYATRLAQLLKADNIALDNAQLWLASSPNNSQARFNTAMLLARDNKPLAALEQMQWLLENNQSTNFALIAAGAARQPDNAIAKEALKTIKTLIAQGFIDASLLTGAAILEKRLENYPSALAFAQQARAQDPNDERIGLLQISLLQVLNKKAEALTLAGELAQQKPNELSLQLQYARMLSDTDPDKALDQFTQLNVLYPNNPDILFPLALLALKKEQTSVAEKYLTQLLKQANYRSAAHYYLGYIAEESQQRQQAIVHFLAVNHGQDYIDAQRRLVNLYTQEGDIASAQKHLHLLQQLQPEEVVQLAIIEANILAQQQQWDDGLKVLNQAIQKHPNSAPLHYARAMLFSQQGNIAEAESNLQFIISLNNNDANALNALGYTLANQTTRYQEAFNYINKALTIEPENPAIMDSMGWVYYKLGNTKKALPYLKAAYEQYADAEVAAHLGEVLWIDGQHKEAMAIWKQALKNNPNNRVILKTIERLQSANPASEQ